jgi:hypothetical protein
MAVFRCREMVDHEIPSIMHLQTILLRQQTIGNPILRQILVITTTQYLLLAGSLLHRAWGVLAGAFRRRPLPITTAVGVEHQDIPSLLDMFHRLDMVHHPGTAHHIRATEARMIDVEEVATDMDMDMDREDLVSTYGLGIHRAIDRGR